MAAKPRILIVDDEISIVEVLKALLRRENYSVRAAANGKEALELLGRERFDLMISDIRMSPVDGLQLLAAAKERQPHIAAIMMTAYGTVETAVQAMRDGAFDYVCKPFKIDEMLLTVQRALSYEHVLAENENLRESLKTKFHFRNLVGNHESMQEVYRMIEKVARTESTVLILGESGTGKELVARALHYHSPRADRPFVAINCAALPETLLESELFGYVKGAFTGANKFKKGLFETADGGTLFLDEIGSIPMSMQLTLLRVLQVQEIRPVGSTETVSVDVRIVAATNEDLETLIAEGRFREDLYYRLSVIPLSLPPLRDRAGDVPLLIRHFLDRFEEQEDRTIRIEPSALQALGNYAWPGNVRELENVVHRAATLCDNDTIDLASLPVKVRDAGPVVPETPAAKQASALTGMTLKAYIREHERSYIRQTIEACDGDKDAAAKALGISLATLYRKYSDD